MRLLNEGCSVLNVVSSRQGRHYIVPANHTANHTSVSLESLQGFNAFYSLNRPLSRRFKVTQCFCTIRDVYMLDCLHLEGIRALIGSLIESIIKGGSR